jgi:hypothetical protein
MFGRSYVVLYGKFVLEKSIEQEAKRKEAEHSLDLARTMVYVFHA